MFIVSFFHTRVTDNCRALAVLVIPLFVYDSLRFTVNSGFALPSGTNRTQARVVLNSHVTANRITNLEGLKSCWVLWN